ncbi:hypothetical protein AQ490_22195 [Wenjunlia vitaminophila]|uniref:Uncharacterized protein n=1 Tax=Wenjunlia vitaminophila TaxID=76728 RepID=A0A0T6LSY8_WENVI|nr:hypothetical protein [Wenjunlia vitaminophila]KRV49025.1 hypothetical protein AQ490_22195 [Wenjunlia vitaminophila]
MHDRYRVIAQPPLSPPGTPVHLLEDLARALNALETPVCDALGVLTTDEVALAFTSLFMGERKLLLRELGIPLTTPRKPSKSLCGDVLSRLQREACKKACACPAQGLTSRVIEDVAMAAWQHDERLETTDPCQRWSPNLVRLAVFAWCEASAVDARALVWLASQGWLGVTAAPAQLETLREAAARVVEATPQAVPGQGHQSRTRTGQPVAPREEGAHAGSDVQPASATTPDHEASGSPVAAAPSPRDTAPTGMPSDQDATDNGERHEPGAVMEPGAALDHLTALVVAARGAVRRVDDAVTGGLPPATNDLGALGALPAAYAQVNQALEAVGIKGVECRLDTLAEAVAAHCSERDRDRAVREALRRLLTMECPADAALTAVLETALGHARDLLDTSSWETGAQRRAAALVALVELVELREQPREKEQVEALRQQVGMGLPDCALVALRYEELFLPETGRSIDARPTSSGAQEQQSCRSEPTSIPEDWPVPSPESQAAPADAPERSALTPSNGTHQPTHLSPPGTQEGHGTNDREMTGPAEPTGGRDPEPAGLTTVRQPDNAGRGDEEPSKDSDDSPTSPAAGEPESAPSESAAEPETPGFDVDDVIARLVTEGRFGLAAHLSKAAGRSAAEEAALRLAAVCTGLRPGYTSGSRLVEEVLQNWDAADARATEGVELVALPALIRAALLTGEHVAGAQLKALAPRLPNGLSAVAVAVADRALNGAMLIAPPMAVIMTMTEFEAERREIADVARGLLKTQRLRFHRATEIAKEWLRPTGILGSTLRAVIDADPQADAQAETQMRETIERWSRLSDIHSEIDRMDQKRRKDHGSSSRVLQGSGRQDLVNLVQRTVECAKAWLELSQSPRSRAATDNEWAVREISEMRQAVLTALPRAVADTEEMARRRATLPAAAARAARDALQDLRPELERGTPDRTTTGWIDPRQALDMELLKVPLPPGASPTCQDLLEAVGRTWDEALELQLEHDAFGAARAILDLAGCGLPAPLIVHYDPSWPSRLSEAEEVRRLELSARHEELVAALRQARFDSAVSDEQDVALQELLADGHPKAEDGSSRELHVVRVILDKVSELLPRHRDEAAARLRARLDALPAITAEQRAQAQRHLDAGQLATAADVIYFLELGEPVPETRSEKSHLSDFFPAVPDRLPKGITGDLIETIRERDRHPHLSALDYRHLSEDEAVRAANALDGWRRLASTKAAQRRSMDIHELLLPALSLLGYEAGSARLRDDLPRTEEYIFAEVSKVQLNGRAWVPAFGSEILEQGRRLRLMLLWGRPAAELLLSQAAKDPSGESLLVLYFGTLGSSARAALAANSTARPTLLVVDDAALAYIAARGNRQVSATTEVLLPFSGVNPYRKDKRGRISREMFYGRDAERKSIIDPEGTQIIFGGRGLGKSALLNDAGERFREQQPGYHHSVYVNLDRHNIGGGAALGADAIWAVLAQELSGRGLDVLPQQQRRKARVTDPHQRVCDGVKNWLAVDPRRRLLVLLDECDRFFETDAPQCAQTRRLRVLCEETRNRFKVVFAGLHSVQRYTRLARNGPYSHLAQTPTVVGPLAPQFAADLLLLPMRALGFEFADMDLVNRVLGYCSYQPFLLQMFGSRLVEVMQRRRTRGVAGPPYTIEAADVEAVESDHSLRADITAAFKDTLNLDDRYRVIANVLADYARHYGLERRLTDVELREECASWWNAGFAHLDSEGFRAYLQEMVGLGVLAPNHDGRGWHLRGPNALRMIGTQQEIVAQLNSAASECELEDVLVLEGRPDLPNRRPAPLTVNQIDDLLGSHTNQTRVVLGTAATGVSDVADALRAVTSRVPGWSAPAIGSTKVFRQQLVSGQAGERRVVISDLAHKEVNVDNCREALELARTLLPSRSGVTRAVVLIAGTDQFGLWRDLLTGSNGSALTVALRRHDRRSLRSWAQRSETFHTDDRLNRLVEVTGGWPMLLDRALDLYAEQGNQDEALHLLAAELQQKELSVELVTASGLAIDPVVVATYQALDAERATGWESEDYLLTVAEYHGVRKEDAVWACACLEAIQALERDGSRLRMEPVLRGCWSRRG